VKYRIISGTDFIAVVFEGSTPLQIDGLEAQIETILADENIEKDDEKRCTVLQTAVGSAEDTTPEYEDDEDRVGYRKPKGGA